MQGDLERKQLFSQVAKIMAMNGLTVDNEIVSLLQPLIDGEQGYEEMAEKLKSMMEDA